MGHCQHAEPVHFVHHTGAQRTWWNCRSEQHNTPQYNTLDFILFNVLHAVQNAWPEFLLNCCFWEVQRLTEQPLLTSIIQKRRLMLFGHLIRMDESADARRILTAVPQSDWRRPLGRPHSWMATLKNDLSLRNLTYEDAIEMALDKPLWGLLAASWAMHWWCMPNNDDDDDVLLAFELISSGAYLKFQVVTDYWARCLLLLITNDAVLTVFCTGLARGVCKTMLCGRRLKKILRHWYVCSVLFAADTERRRSKD